MTRVIALWSSVLNKPVFLVSNGHIESKLLTNYYSV